MTYELPRTAHTLHPWRIHEIAADFELEDVWALPTPGGPDDFRLLVEAITTSDPETQTPSRAARLLWTTRWTLGRLFGWDRPNTGLGSRVPSLRERLPVDLRDTAPPEFDRLPFESLYLLDDEFAAEVANKTVHGVMHLSWVTDGAGGYRGQMAVLVKPNGLLGKAYLAAIRPFRHHVVYPPMLRRIEREWQTRANARIPAA